MRSPLFRPGQWDPHVPPELKEPFPWAHPNYPRSLHPFREPRTSVMFGVAVVAAGLSMFLVTVGQWRESGEGAAIAAGTFTLVLFGAIGGWAVYLGSTRMRWKRRFTDHMGFSPFDRAPGQEAPGPQGHAGPEGGSSP
jgi:hypothetical protein